MPLGGAQKRVKRGERGEADGTGSEEAGRPWERLCGQGSFQPQRMGKKR